MWDTGVMTMKLAICAIIAGLASPVAAQDWSGIYGGLSLSRTTGGVDQINAGVLESSFSYSGNQVGAFVGYGIQQGNLVYGGELSFGNGDISNNDVTPEENYLSGTLDLRGRVGYATGNLLVYGALGWSKADVNFAGVAAADEPLSASGLSYGLGVDMHINDRMFVGAEVQRRNLDMSEGDIPGFPTYSEDFGLTSVNLRLGMKF